MLNRIMIILSILFYFNAAFALKINDISTYSSDNRGVTIKKICIEGYVYYVDRGDGGRLVQKFVYDTKKGTIPVKCENKKDSHSWLEYPLIQ